MGVRDQREIWAPGTSGTRHSSHLNALLKLLKLLKLWEEAVMVILISESFPTLLVHFNEMSNRGDELDDRGVLLKVRKFRIQNFRSLEFQNLQDSEV